MVDKILNYSSIEKRFCVEWQVHIPMSKNISVTSSNFPFESSPYFFKLSKTNGSGNYDLVLDRADPSESSNKSFSVVIYLVRDDESVSKYFSINFNETFPLIFRGITPKNFTLYQRFNPSGHFYGARIVCFIRSALPFDCINEVIIDSNKSWPMGWLETQFIPGVSKSTQTNDLDISSNLESLSLDLSNLLKKETLPDVRLRCGDRIIPAHRSVLAARSDVFAAMFQNEMSESQTGAVDVEDLDEQVFDAFLKYVYSGKFQAVPDDDVPGLYVAADKYAVDTLKTWCRQQMTCGLTERNCVRFLTVADAHSDTDFKEAVISFICSHDAVFESDDWLQFSKLASPLVVEVYHSFVRSRTKKS